VAYDREEEIYFVAKGSGVLHYGDEPRAMRQSDFTYLPPGVKHSIANDSGEAFAGAADELQKSRPRLRLSHPTDMQRSLTWMTSRKENGRRSSDVGALQALDWLTKRQTGCGSMKPTW